MNQPATVMANAFGTEEIIRAGGGIVTRPGANGEVEVVLVHRPGREDWTFPKGKQESGETIEQCALREVFEETALVCELVSFVGHTRYRDRKDRPKIVAYWIMAALRFGEFIPGDEVDEVRWVDLDTAAEMLSYERDHELLGFLASEPSLSS